MPKAKYCDCVSTIPNNIKIGYKNYKLEEWKQTVASANEAQVSFFLKKVL